MDKTKLMCRFWNSNEEKYYNKRITLSKPAVDDDIYLGQTIRLDKKKTSKLQI